MKKLNIDEQLLRKLYFEDLLSLKDISIELGIGFNTVKRRFKEYGIPVRENTIASKIALDKKIKKITNLICPNCNKEFQIKNSLIDKSDKHFCSMNCSATYYSNLKAEERKNGKVVKCYACGKEHYRAKRLIYANNRHFCSRKCFGLYQSLELTGENNALYNRAVIYCSNCNKEILRVKSKISEKNNYCSKECMAEHYVGLVYGENHPSWKGGRGLYYGHDWNRISKSIIERDNHTCQRCGIKEDELLQSWKLQVHHKKPLREYSSLEEANNPENLVSLCNRCHGIVEHHGIDF